MKILYAGVFASTSTNYSQANALHRRGVTVHKYEYRYVGNLLGDDGRDNDLFETVKRVKPDWVLIAKGNGIGVKTIIKIQNELNVPVSIWFMDAVCHWSQELEHKIMASTAVFCDKLLAYKLAKAINPNTFRVCEGFDPIDDQPWPDVPEIHPVSFIGSLYGQRKDLLWAAGGVKLSGYGKSHAKLVAQSKINLNFCTSQCASDRVYKVLAAKGFLLTDDWAGRELVDGASLVIFRDKEDLVSKIDYYLNHPEERKIIAEHGYNMVQKYSRAFWAERIVQCLQSIAPTR